MNDGRIEKRLREIIGREFSKRRVSELGMDDNLIDALGIDSQSLLCLILAIEEGFSVQIDDTSLKLDDVSSLGSLVHLVKKHHR